MLVYCNCVLFSSQNALDAISREQCFAMLKIYRVNVHTKGSHTSMSTRSDRCSSMAFLVFYLFCTFYHSRSEGKWTIKNKSMVISVSIVERLRGKCEEYALPGFFSKNTCLGMNASKKKQTRMSSQTTSLECFPVWRLNCI